MQRYFAMPPLSPIPPSPLPSNSSSIRSSTLRSPILSPNEVSIIQRLGSGDASRMGSQRSLTRSPSPSNMGPIPAPSGGNLAYLASRRRQSVAQNRCRRTSNFLELPGNYEKNGEDTDKKQQRVVSCVCQSLSHLAAIIRTKGGKACKELFAQILCLFSKPADGIIFSY